MTGDRREWQGGAAPAALTLALWVACAPAGAGGEANRARQILDTCGVRGGLVVHVGCGDGKLTAALHANDSYLVHGLDHDASHVERARKHIRSRGLCGKVSAERWAGPRLPYADGLVSLLVSDDLGAVPMQEVMRALRPLGVAYVRQHGTWRKTVKPWPRDIDEWTHFLHDATGNAVAHDTVVGPPHHLRWKAGPTHTRHHEHVSSLTTVVSARGRLFYILDEGPRASMFLAPKWFLIARDAFNGVLLWKRPIDAWQPHLTGMMGNPPWLQRTLVAVGDHVYATLGLCEAVSRLDAATGHTLRTYDTTKGAEEIVCAGDRLFVVARRPAGSAGPSRDPKRRPWSLPKRIVALDPDTGSVRWEKSDPDAATLLPLTLAVHDDRVFFKNENAVVCLDAGTGREQWRRARQAVKRRSPVVAPTLVACRDVVLCADQGVDARGAFAAGELVALSAADGRQLWSRPCAMGWASPVDVFVADGLVWFGARRGRGWIVGADKKGEADFAEGLDPLTGEVKRTLDTTAAFINRPHHHRCYRDKATDRFLLIGRHGVGFIPLGGGGIRLHDWIRGTCRYGVLPCNGLLYLPPHTCCCHVRSLLSGFHALAPARGDGGRGTRDGGRGTRDEGKTPGLERGPAFAAIHGPQSAVGNSHDWPTFRATSARSGSTATAVPVELKPLWQTRPEGPSRRLSSVVVAGGKLFVAAVDAHTVHALDANSGKTVWSHTACGRVDSPPTIEGGRVLFGSADGWVTCLRASDGELAWRFRAAPHDNRVVVDNQIESVWPVHGSVLVEGGSAYVSAGRTSSLDGGIRVYQLDVDTGRVLSQTRLDSRQPGAARRQEGLPDVMVSDGQFACMRFQRFALRDVKVKPRTNARGRPLSEPPRLICPTGFLDGSWWHRAHWVFGKSRVFGSPIYVGTRAPAGQLLVFDDGAVYGYGRKPQYFMWTTPVEHRLFAADKRAKIVPIEPKRPQPKQAWLRHPERRFATRWSVDVPLHVRAMVLAGGTLLIAGPPTVAREGEPQSFVRKAALTPEQAKAALDAWEGKAGGLLWAVAAADGRKLAEYQLGCPPVFDGMAAAYGRLYVSTTKGEVICLGRAQ